MSKEYISYLQAKSDAAATNCREAKDKVRRAARTSGNNSPSHLVAESALQQAQVIANRAREALREAEAK